MSSEKELTPEEKLLALIQQDKRPEPAAAAERPASPPATPAPPPAPAVAAPAQPLPPVQSAPVVQPPPPPPAAASVPAVAPAQTAPKPAPVPEKPQAAVPAASGAEAKPRPAPAPAVAAPAASVSAEPGPKLKLAPSPVVPPAKAPPAAPAPARETPAPGPEAADKQAVAAPAAPADRPPAAAAAPKPVKARVSTVLNWPILNRSLALVVLVLLVVVVYSLASVQSDIDKAMFRQVNQAGTLPMQVVGIETVTPMPLEDCLRKVSGRDIFKLADVAGGRSGASSNAAPAAAEFKLVGVSVDGRDPKASMAIVRSKTPPQTYFVKVGDAVGNTGFTLDRVLADRAILKKQRQEIEVR